MRRTRNLLIIFSIAVAALVVASIAFGRPSRPNHPPEASVAATLSLARPQNPVSREETFRIAPAITTTTTTEEPPTTTTTAAPVVVKPAPAPAPAPAAAPPSDGDFWWRLGPGCESSTDGGGNGGGFFQFSPDTAAKVGYHRGQSYEQQVAEAQAWAARIHPYEGTNSGWPHCWWQALAG